MVLDESELSSWLLVILVKLILPANCQFTRGHFLTFYRQTDRDRGYLFVEFDCSVQLKLNFTMRMQCICCYYKHNTNTSTNEFTKQPMKATDHPQKDQISTYKHFQGEQNNTATLLHDGVLHDLRLGILLT